MKLSSETRLDSLFDDHVEAVYAYAFRRTGSEMAAEDIAAEVFSEVAARHEKVPSKEIRPWLFGVARRKVADHFRRRRMDAPLIESLEDRAESPLKRAMADEATGQLRQLVESLLPDQREALLLYYVEGLSVKQVAIAMRRSRFAVNSLLQRARRRLHEEGRGYFLEDGNTER